MRMADTDIDIDFADRDAALATLTYVPAAMAGQEGPVRHPSGVYFQNIPVDPIHTAAAFPYGDAARMGFFKIDFLNNSVYQGVRNEAHLIELVEREPLWALLDEPGLVSQLAHIHNYYGVVQSVRPKSIEDLAIVLALIRGPKRHLLGRPRSEIEAEIWKPEADGYWFKKSHSLAYALAIVVQMNLICDALSHEEDEDIFGLP